MVRLQGDSQGEADELGFVAGGLGDGDGEIDGEGQLSEEGDGDACAQPNVGADFVDGDIFLDGADIDEDDAAEDFFPDGVIDFGGGDPFEVAADGVVEGTIVGPCAAELESAEGADAAGVEALEEGGFAGDVQADFVAEGEGGFPFEEILVEGE